jgi:uncharacterized protein involved in exopolysaccharide biosynthesis
MSDVKYTPEALAALHRQEREPDVDVGAFARFLAYNKWLLAGCVLVTAGCAGVYAWTATPIYRAETVLKPITDQGESGLGTLNQFSGLASLAGVKMGGGTDNTATALATLDANSFLSRFIEDQHLLPVLFANRWDAERQAWDPDAGDQPPTMWDAVQKFRNILSLYPDKDTGLVTLSIEWRDREAAARWANLLVERVNAHLRAGAIRDAEDSIEYLNREYAGTVNMDVRAAIGHLLERQLEQITLANVRKEFVFKVIDPAIPPPPGKFVKPKRTVLLGVGVLLGAVLGVLAALVRASFASARRAPHEADARGPAPAPSPGASGTTPG